MSVKASKHAISMSGSMACESGSMACESGSMACESGSMTFDNDAKSERMRKSDELQEKNGASYSGKG